MKDLWDFDPPDGIAVWLTEAHSMNMKVKKWFSRVAKTWDLAKRAHIVNEALQSGQRLGDKGAVVLREALGACKSLFSAKRDFSGYTGAMLDGASNTVDKAVPLFQERPDIIDRATNEHRFSAQPTPVAGYVPEDAKRPVNEDDRYRAAKRAGLLCIYYGECGN